MPSVQIPTFAYPGGKARLARRIAAMLPPSGKRFVDVFAGRGNISFAVMQLLDYEKFWINDPGTVRFYVALLGANDYKVPRKSKRLFCKHRSKTLLHHFQGFGELRRERIEWEQWDNRWLKGRPHPEVSPDRDDEHTMMLKDAKFALAMAEKRTLEAYLFEPYLVRNGGRHNSGVGYHSGLKGGVSRKRFEKNVRLAASMIYRLWIEEDRLKLTGEDYMRVLSRCGPDDVCFVDPPYIGANVSSYTDRTLNHAKMIEMLIRAKFRWVLSEYDHPIYDPLTQIFGKPVKIRVHKSMGNHGSRAIECLWRNFNATTGNLLLPSPIATFLLRPGIR